MCTYNKKGAADQMWTTLKQIVKYSSTIYRQDISNEIHNRAVVTIDNPQHTQEAQDKQTLRVARLKLNYQGLITAITNIVTALEVHIESGGGRGDLAIIALVELQNEMANAEVIHGYPLEIILHGDDKVEQDGKWRSYRESTSLLKKHRGQAYSIIMGQCAHQFLDKMKQDTSWTMVSKDYKPWALLYLIKKTALSQTEGQYPCAIVYAQEILLYIFYQNLLTNDQWYDRFNTKVDVGISIGITRQHDVLMEWTSQQVEKQSFTTLLDANKLEICGEAEERYLAYVFLKQSAKTSEKLRTSLSNKHRRDVKIGRASLL